MYANVAKKMMGETKTIVGIAFLTIVILLGGAFILSKGSTPSPQNIDQNLLIGEDSNKISTSSAELTVIEFGDYQCPACGAAHPIVKRILGEYKEKINFVYRHLAFLGQESNWASEAAECAGEQGKFWEYHNYLFENQSGENQGAFSKENLESFAKILDLDIPKFNSCVDSGKYSQKVLGDRGDGQALGVNSTPTFFIDGEKSAGVIGYDDFRRRIEAKLQK